MAYELDVRGFTAPAAASLSGNFGFCGVINSSGQLALQTTAGGRVNGIIYSDTPAAGLPVEVISSGVAKVAIGAAVAAGDSLEVDATGRVITATGTTGHKPIGTALTAGATVGQLIPVQLMLIS